MDGDTVVFLWIGLIAILIIICAIVDNKNGKPLNEDEIAMLSKARKAIYINTHFKFSDKKYNVNPKYRACIASDGRWDKVSIAYSMIPSFVADLLRLKRHEWHVYVLSNENEGKWVWCHKGDDNSQVRIAHLLMAFAADKAIASGCNTIISMHNHPHIQERYWNLLKPSDADLECFETEEKIFNENGLNLICGIVSQGEYSIYGYSFPTSYMPHGCSIEEIKEANGNNRKANAKLREELRKTKNEVIGKGLFW